MTRTYYAPAWAMELKDTYARFSDEEHGNSDSAHGVFHAGRQALQTLGFSFSESCDFFLDHRTATYVEDCEPRVEERPLVQDFHGACSTWVKVEVNAEGDSLDVKSIAPYWNAKALRELSQWAADAADALDSATV